jgi:hypothetical protein
LSFIVNLYAPHKRIRDFYSNFDSGLQIQNYRNDNHPNHTVIAIAGTNGLNDWDDNLSFVTGGLSEQFQQAMTHAAKTIDAAVKNSEHADTIQGE